MRKLVPSAIAIGARSDLKPLEQDIKKAARDAGREESKVLSVKVDVCDREALENAAKEIEKEFGRTGYLAQQRPFTPIAESDPDEWWYTWTVNMRGPLSRYKVVSTTVAENKSSTCPVSAHTQLDMGQFMEFIMSEYGDKGVLAFAVHPGGVMTEMGARMPSQIHSLLTDTPGVAGDTIVYLTQGKRDWLAGRYISCTCHMEFLAKKDEIVSGDKLKVRMAV